MRRCLMQGSVDHTVVRIEWTYRTQYPGPWKEVSQRRARCCFHISDGKQRSPMYLWKDYERDEVKERCQLTDLIHPFHNILDRELDLY